MDKATANSTRFPQPRVAMRAEDEVVFNVAVAFVAKGQLFQVLEEILLFE
jgi:hypothetical protein